MASFPSFTLRPDDEARINTILRRDTDALTSYYITKEIIYHRAELIRFLLRPGIVERVLDFLSNDDLLDDKDSSEVIDTLLGKIIYAPSESPWFNVDKSIIDSFVAKLTYDTSYVCEAVIKLLAKLTQNSNVQMHAARAGAIDILIPMLSSDGFSSARGSILELLANIAQNPVNVIWFGTCDELVRKMPAMLHHARQSVRYRAARLMASLCTHKKKIAPEVAIIMIDLLLVAAIRNAHDEKVHEELTSALSSLREVPEYCSMIDRNTLVLAV